jgi:hypothetical protein
LWKALGTKIQLQHTSHPRVTTNKLSYFLCRRDRNLNDSCTLVPPSPIPPGGRNQMSTAEDDKSPPAVQPSSNRMSTVKAQIAPAAVPPAADLPTQEAPGTCALHPHRRPG